jgi:hypothetical protein
MAALLAESAIPKRNFARMENTVHSLHSNTKLGAGVEKLKPLAVAVPRK